MVPFRVNGGRVDKHFIKKSQKKQLNKKELLLTGWALVFLIPLI